MESPVDLVEIMVAAEAALAEVALVVLLTTVVVLEAPVEALASEEMVAIILL